MAKKKSSSSSSTSSYNKTLLQIQKLANSSAKSIQQMINKSNTQQMTFNSAESQKARDWQEKMTKSSHQMEVADLKKAGLNPVLSAGGSGAQSYTTSSASTQNDSGASATSGILSEQIGAMTNLESSRMSSEAQKKAAAATASAMRYSAQQSAAAQRYAANVEYAKAKYRADIDYKINKEQIKASKWISNNKQASTPFGLFDKYAQKVLKHAPKNVNVTGFLNAGRLLEKKFSKDPSKYIKNFETANAKNVFLTDKGKLYANNVLKKMGIKQTGPNRRLVVSAYFAGDRKAYKTLINKVPQTHIVSLTRPGYR